MKGVSVIIATILLLLIIIAIIGFSYTFFWGLQDSATNLSDQRLDTSNNQMATAFVIDNVDPAGTISIRNTGSATLDNFAVYVDNLPIQSQNFPILPATIGDVVLSDPMAAGQHSVRVTTGAKQDTKIVVVPDSWAFDWDVNGVGGG